MQTTYPIILAIDTSCDDTSVAVTQGMCVLSNVIASQTELHRKYGGVMPLVAKLAHNDLINPTYQEALKRAKIREEQIDAIAVTYGPGLAIALEVGIDYAKILAQEFHRPLIGVNHMSGHLFSSLAVNSHGDPKPDIKPALAFLVSGGHTEIVMIETVDTQIITQKLGQTVDDAAGECLDKFARMLDLGYPGAHVMETLAKSGDSLKYEFPLPMTTSGDLNFSFSGLKTSGRHMLEKITSNHEVSLIKEQIQDLSASFQRAVFRHLTYKFKKALDQYQPQVVWLGGGVVNNLQFRQDIRKICSEKNIAVKIPYTKKLMSDNAAMIGIAAYFKYLNHDFIDDFEKFQRVPRLTL